MTNDLPFVSIIIPVYNDREGLQKTLTALKHQTCPSSRFEVIVVDNASTADIESVTSAFEHARLVFEGKRGSYAARNRGLRAARGSYLAFTDADCIPDRDWVEQGVRRLQRADRPGIVGGRIDFSFRDPDRLTAAEYVDSMTAFKQKAYCEEEHFAVTANLWTRAEVFETVGPFNEELQSGGDTEWGHRVHQHGYQIEYADTVRVVHPARATGHALAKKWRRIARGIYNRKSARGYPFAEMAAETFTQFRPAVRTSLRILRDPQLKDLKTRVEAVALFTWVRMVAAWTKASLWARGRPRAEDAPQHGKRQALKRSGETTDLPS